MTAGPAVAPRRSISRAYRFITGGDGLAGLGVVARGATHTSARIRIGRALLVVLFLVIPLFNPAVVYAGDERFYLGGVVVLVAALLMLPSLVSGRFDWMLVAFLFGGLYVLEVALLRGNLGLGLIGNAYRPLHAVLTFCACAVFLLGTDRDRWTRLFLLGGLAGAGLAVLNTVFPAFDPFALSRPDIGYEPLFLESERQSGAFVYPGNFGPYCAYVAIVALVMLERAQIRFTSLNLYTATFVVAVLGLLTSGSRGAAMGLLTGTAIVLWRTPRYRLPVVTTVAGALALVTLGLVLAGNLAEIVRSRLLLADFSFEERLRSWSIAWDGLQESFLFGGGIISNTVDNIAIYYLGVGGFVGLVIVAAMYWSSVLRPLRFRDWTGLPLVGAVIGVGLTQESLGTPLSSWAIAAGLFLLTARDREEEILAPKPRTPLVLPGRGGSAVAAAALFLAIGVGIGALVAGRLPSREPVQTLVILPIERTIAIPAEVLGGSKVHAATDGNLRRSEQPLWLVETTTLVANASRYTLDGEESVRLESLAIEGDAIEGLTEFDVVGWEPAEDEQFFALSIRPRKIEVWMASDGEAPIRRGAADLPLKGAEVIRNARLARWSGALPDLFVVEHGRTLRDVTIRAFSGESRFRDSLFEIDVRLPFAEETSWTIDVARVTGDRPDLLLFAARGPSGRNEIHIVSGDSNFEDYILHAPTDFPPERAENAAFAAGTTGGSPVIYAVDRSKEGTEVAVVPLRQLP